MDHLHTYYTSSCSELIPFFALRSTPDDSLVLRSRILCTTPTCDVDVEDSASYMCSSLSTAAFVDNFGCTIAGA
jgi:hypothetical protein